MSLCGTAAILGVRESRRITCDYTLNVNDFISRAVFEDEIGRYCYPVDIHVMNTDKKEYERFEKEYETLRFKKGESYGIPFRSLVPKSFSNVLVAGRCIGTDRQMQASVRVMPGCFITGQAAGTAAAPSATARASSTTWAPAPNVFDITSAASKPTVTVELSRDTQGLSSQDAGTR